MPLCLISRSVISCATIIAKRLINIADVAADVGNFSAAILVPFYIAGEASGDIRAKRVALDIGASSISAAGIISPVLKFIAGNMDI